MKKWFLLPSLLFIYSINSYGQGVGINISTPVSMLDVAGGITIGATYSGNDVAPANGALIEGSVGIGTTNPNSLLHVSGTNAGNLNPITVHNSNTGATATTGIISRFNQTNGTARVGGNIIFGKEQAWTTVASTRDSYIAFENILNGVSSERFRVSSDGKVGIGTDSPGELLDVDGDMFVGGGNTLISPFSTFATQNPAFLQIHDGTASATSNYYASLLLTGNQTGTTDQTVGQVVFVNSSLGTAEKRIANIVGRTDGATNNGHLVFRTMKSGTLNEQMRITSDGYIGIGSDGPTSGLDIKYSIALPLTTKVADYTASVNDFTILVNASSGAKTITLPPASGAEGRIYIIKKISATSSPTNDVIIDGDGGDTIDGSITLTLTTLNERAMLQSDGSNWYRID